MLIEAHELRRRFGRKVAVDGVTLRVNPGEVVALAGPNGAGKTTLLRILMGFLAPDRGEIQVLDENPVTRRKLDEIGWMPERPEFPARLTVGQLIDFQAATFPSWDHSLAEDLEDRLDIERPVRAGSLSRGQSGRLALLFALAHRPRLLILDDPTLGLDPVGRRLLLGELLSAACEAGTGILISTHLLAEAEWSIDRMAILKDGRILVDGPVDELKSRHRKLSLPEGAPLPQELAPIGATTALVTTKWDEDAWTRYRSDVPEAAAESLRLEDLYVSVMEAAQ